MKLRNILLLMSLTLMNCESNSNEDCSAVTCEALNYKIKLTDKDTRGNIILERQYVDGDIEIINSENEKVESNILNGNIIIYPSKELHGNHRLIVDGIEIVYSYNFTEGGTACCDFGSLKNVSVEQREFIFENNDIEIFLTN